jgi:hypothetical protein
MSPEMSLLPLRLKLPHDPQPDIPFDFVFLDPSARPSQYSSPRQPELRRRPRGSCGVVRLVCRSAPRPILIRSGNRALEATHRPRQRGQDSVWALTRSLFRHRSAVLRPR